MIDGEIYVRTSYPKSVFAYRKVTENPSQLTHYACVIDNYVYINGYGGSCGRISGGDVRPAHEEEIELFVDKLNRHGFYYNKANRRVINIRTGRLV